MKRILILTSLLVISSAYAELDDYQIEMADNMGRNNAATSFSKEFSSDSFPLWV
jgi:hypothetical protein